MPQLTVFPVAASPGLIGPPSRPRMLRCRTEVLGSVQAHNRQLQEEAQATRRPPPRSRRGEAEAPPARDPNAELITTMLAAVEKEHEFL